MKVDVTSKTDSDNMYIHYSIKMSIANLNKMIDDKIQAEIKKVADESVSDLFERIIKERLSESGT